MPPSSSPLPGKPPAFLTGLWFYFFVFTATNTVLAYTSLDLETKMWVCLAGFIIPFLTAFWALPAQSIGGSGPLNEETFKSIPSWVVWGVLCLGIVVRSYSWLNSNWIIPDEGYFSQLSIELHKKWEWQFFFTPTQIPPLGIWALSLYYRLVTPSVFSTRFFFYMASVLALLLSYLASRMIFSRSAALLCVLFFAFGFWPLLFSEFSDSMQPAFTAQMAALFFLAFFLKSRPENKSIWAGLVLGLAAGLGFWVSIPWPFMVLMVVLAVIPKLSRSSSPVSVGMVSGFLLLFIPFLVLSWMNKNGDHIKFLWALYRHMDPAQELKNIFSNWALLFWEDTPGNRFGPVWGGVLNPLEGAFCFLGIIEFIRSWRSPFSRWVLAAAFVFVLPGLLTNGYEIFHNQLLSPLLIVFSVCGAQLLLLKVPAGGRTFALAVLVLASSCLNLVHWYKSYAPCSSEFSNSDPEYLRERRCISILDQTFRQKGPGFLLWDLLTYREQSLRLETYPFNAADNPGIRESDARWTAVLCNANYKPFLGLRFPNSKWYWVGPDSFWHEGGLVLGVIPIDGSNREVLSQWREANAHLSLITRELLFDHNGMKKDLILKEMKDMEGDMGQDPFLKSVFCERVLQESGQGPPGKWIPWVEKALAQGYPSPHLWVAKGILLQAEGKKPEARKAFEKAVHSPLNLTDARERIQNMGQ